jgi:hypothetical protein
VFMLATSKYLSNYHVPEQRTIQQGLNTNQYFRCSNRNHNKTRSHHLQILATTHKLLYSWWMRTRTQSLTNTVIYRG